jgi:glutathione synthase/RimK-type ligase-like ATP-grasp enzyme
MILLSIRLYNTKNQLEYFNNTNNTNNTNKVVVIIHTEKSYAFANKICSNINSSCFKSNVLELENTITSLPKYDKLIIHPRTATPINTNWIRYLKKLEKNGAIIVNPPRLLQLTSNKLECAFVLYNAGINHPKTWKGLKNNNETVKEIQSLLQTHHKLIIKPYNSISQGAYVKLLKNGFTNKKIRESIDTIPTDPFVIQEYVNYSAIYRVIVIGGKALPFSFIDRPTPEKWKVSVCLNRDTMKFIYNPNPKLLKLAVDTQNVINKHVNNKYSGIHFIDIFETTKNNFTISEINTACSLFIHERLAKNANHPKWEISKFIAAYLNSL